jgi:hypothetical protein
MLQLNSQTSRAKSTVVENFFAQRRALRVVSSESFAHARVMLRAKKILQSVHARATRLIFSRAIKSRVAYRRRAFIGA